MANPAPIPSIPLDTTMLPPGLRLAVGLSGGADSVALTRALAAHAAELGIVLHAAHLHHGLRGVEADRDQQFAAELAQSLGIQFHTHQVDTAAEATRAPETGKSSESIEEAARRLRYAWFRQLMASHQIDAVATAHTLDDQAETVLGKFLRGAWTEGLSGIHPVVQFPEGRILRLILSATRSQVESYLAILGQPWREDASNQDPTYTRNRLRHQLLPELEQWNPRIREHLNNMATLARDEEAWWASEIARLAPQLLLSGRPVRGGGRASTADSAIAIDTVRLAAQPVAMQRRLLRHAAAQLGVSLSFDAAESLRQLGLQGRSGQQLALPGPITAERTPRELRLAPHSAKAARSANRAESSQPTEFQLPIPGETTAFGRRFRAQAAGAVAPATIRNWRPGDRVTLRYSSGPRKIKEVLERLKVTGTARATWPVVEWQGQIIWMQGAELAPHSEMTITAEEE
ncbi:tRNA lysidine(34) synthetase TilS [Acidicapsa acidisoli]|uniref:tRNA lysidine(34) synthetase TilS n=1 Tax=Acidicapsa acidisoli TaxID=1615681 RepID=UPI0021E09276|nr:tRNA lysidine(34) synthetase TilS [Acidicapsa acidisoli]